MCFAGSLGAGSVSDRQNGNKLTNMEPKGHQKEANNYQNINKSLRDVTKMVPKAPKVPQKTIKQIKKTLCKNGRRRDVNQHSNLLGPDHIFSRYILRSCKFKNQNRYSSKSHAKTGNEKNNDEQCSNTKCKNMVT